ncbi:MAG: hypothetical protein AAFX94_00305 [Myxococcota bacterium]
MGNSDDKRCSRNTSDEAQDGPLTALLREIHGDDVGEFVGRHHVRAFRDDIPYHVISRVAGGLAWLVPSDELNRIIAGVLAHALNCYPQVQLYAFAFLSNHFHIELRGGPSVTPAFMRYVKQQISLRVGSVFGRSGPTMWDGPYLATALPSSRAQERAFRYILAHGVKEGLVERPEEWPGLHSAKQTFFDIPLEGQWFDGTRFAKALYKERQKPEPKQRPLTRAEFTTRYHDLKLLSRLPALRQLDDNTYRAYLSRLRDEIIADGRVERAGRAVLGVRRVISTPRDTPLGMTKPDWYQIRRRMIAWDDPHSPESVEFRRWYWSVQKRYRACSAQYRNGDLTVEFPTCTFRPCTPVMRPAQRKAA